MTLGEKILKYRKHAGLSQEELADKMKVTRQSISLWETDQTVPSLDNLIMLAELFNVSMDELCGTMVKSAEEVQSCVSEKTEYLACAQTKYSIDLIKYINRLTAKRFYAINILFIVFSIFMGIGIITSSADNAWLILPIFFAAVPAVLVILRSLELNKRAAEIFNLNPNCVAKIRLFQDYFDLEVTSDNTNSKSIIRYSNVKKVQNTSKCILIYYGNNIVPIEKNLPDINYDLILKLLNVPSDGTGIELSRKIKILLLTMFILSPLSIFMGLIAIVICMNFSPLPEFMYASLEYMGILYLFIPLPLASAVLGIVFYTKKYKCKKNIIAGFIMCALLSIYGSFPFILSDYVIHDFGYVRELEQIIALDLPDSGYISRAKNTDSKTKSVAMIKFDDANEINGIVSTDWRFSDSTNFIPLNFIDPYYTSFTSGYHYFMLTDVTDNEVEVGQAHRYIFLAYNKDKNILFVLDFIK